MEDKLIAPLTAEPALFENSEKESGVSRSDSLKVGIFIQHFPPQLGGAECQAKLLAAVLAQSGQRVEVVTTRHRRDLPALTSSGQLTIRRLPTVAPRWLKLPFNLVAGFVAGLWLLRCIDVVHAHCLSPFVLGALLAARIRRRPVLVKICTLGVNGDIAKVKAFGPAGLFWRLYRGADLFIAQTRPVAEELVSEGIARSRVLAIPNMLERRASIPAPVNKPAMRRRLGMADKLTVAYVGRLHPDKGLVLLMRQWPALAARFDVQLLLVGEGPLRPELQSWRASAEFGDSVTLAGYQADPTPYYQAADVFVFPSTSEAFGNAIVEAMSHGLAVATTRVGIVTEWDDAAPVAIIDTGRPDDIGRVVGNLLESAVLRNELGTRAADFVRGRFDPDVICAEYLRQYRRLLRGPSTRSGRPV